MKLSTETIRRLFLGTMALALIAALAWVALRTGPLAPVRVQTLQVATGRVQPEVFGIGLVEARQSWKIGPTASGRLLAVQVDVGDVVQAGQVLAEIDAVDLGARMAALEAGYAAAQSQQQAAQAQVLDAQARHTLASSRLKRQQDLAQQQFISAGALDAYMQETASASAGLQNAQARHAATAQDLKRLNAERAALSEQRQRLTLVAPAAAIVSSRDAEAGSTVVAGQAVIQLIDPASLWVRLRVDQGRSAGLAAGLPGRIVLRSRPGEAFAGQVARIEPLADAVTEERLAQVAFDAVPAGISVGEMAEVTLQLPDSDEGLVLPNAALHRLPGNGQSGVWRLQDGTLQFVKVQLGAGGLDGQVRVTPLEAGGLKQGDTVVLYSEKPLQANTRIQVVEQLQGATK